MTKEFGTILNGLLRPFYYEVRYYYNFPRDFPRIYIRVFDCSSAEEKTNQDKFT